MVVLRHSHSSKLSYCLVLKTTDYEYIKKNESLFQELVLDHLKRLIWGMFKMVRVYLESFGLEHIQKNFSLENNKKKMLVVSILGKKNFELKYIKETLTDYI